ncbi:Glucoside xylosyltransferase 1 [Camelus dromedarius]|uniref:Glucoside xylosyltransferase 1 n=1 Tax=Camelus dromedarius TaxID=9838 RepID=A0A5N4DFC5_CAMDR|nr:Glucoside xylosyltransferase 1 [Camelus dromedarius]
MRRYLRVVVLCLACGFCSLSSTPSPARRVLEEERAAVAGSRRPQRFLARAWTRRRAGGRPRGPAGPAAHPGRSDRAEKNVIFSSVRYSVKAQPVERMHLAVVACGERLQETVTMLKSALIFSIKPLQVHIFAEDQLHDSFKGILDSWSFLQTFNYSLYPITFPSENAVEWKKLFKPCASQRLFLPLILKDVDSLLYVDTDILFLRPIDDIWSLLKKFNSTQIAAMAPEHEEPRIGWYNRFARHPYYGKTGVNSGVMLMNMTRMRRKYFKIELFRICPLNLEELKKSVSSVLLEHYSRSEQMALHHSEVMMHIDDVNDMTAVRLRWGDILMPLLKKYKLNITWGDQDLLNIIFFHNPESLFVFPCQWNYRPDHCIYGSNCREAEEEGIFILHGNRGVYHDDKQPAFRAVYEALRNCSFEDDNIRSLLKPLELELQKTVHTYCGKSYKIFIKQLAKSIQDRYTRPPKER